MNPDDPPAEKTTTDTDERASITANIQGTQIVAAVGSGITQTVFIEEQSHNVHGLLPNPYLGLRAFTYNDRAFYAGREQLAEETVARLTNPMAPVSLLFIIGASGSGKSSLAQAGLLPQLEQHYASYGQHVRHAVFRPSSQPMILLRDALRKLHPTLIDSSKLAVNTPTDQINVLLIDQFEELFIQSVADQRTQLIDFLLALPPFEIAHTHVLITLRVDYQDELYANKTLWNLSKQGIDLRPMSCDELRDAIQKPLQVHYQEKRFARDLLDRLVQDASQDATLLPLLQVTLAKLWKQGSLTLGNYHTLTDAIRQWAETVYTYIDHERSGPHQERAASERAELLRIFLDLVNVSPDDVTRRDVRQRRARVELTQGLSQRAQLIEALINARLLASSIETLDDQTVERVDIIHESLIDNWPRLRQAIDEDRQQLQRRARFKLWLGLWLQNQRNDEYLLLTAVQLDEARKLAARNDIELQNPVAGDFYERSLAHQTTIAQRRLADQQHLVAEQVARQQAETAHSQLITQRAREQQQQAYQRQLVIGAIGTGVGYGAAFSWLLMNWQPEQFAWGDLIVAFFVFGVLGALVGGGIGLALWHWLRVPLVAHLPRRFGKLLVVGGSGMSVGGVSYWLIGVLAQNDPTISSLTLLLVGAMLGGGLAGGASLTETRLARFAAILLACTVASLLAHGVAGRAFGSDWTTAFVAGLMLGNCTGVAFASGLAMQR
jgi:energy-coupling factor transporter ATP-binding protein EcfA2